MLSKVVLILKLKGDVEKVPNQAKVEWDGVINPNTENLKGNLGLRALGHPTEILMCVLHFFMAYVEKGRDLTYIPKRVIERVEFI